MFFVRARVAIARGKSSGWLRPRSARTAATAARFKVGASLLLPIVDDGAPWDRSAATAGVFAASGPDKPWGDGFLARKCHLIYDATRPDLKSSYRFLFARIGGGVPMADPPGLAEARLALEACADFPIDVRMKALRVLDFYCEKVAMIARRSGVKFPACLQDPPGRESAGSRFLPGARADL